MNQNENHTVLNMVSTKS